MSPSVGCLAWLITQPLVAALRGWVLSILWLWFVVPSFNVPPLSIPAALGIALLVTLMPHRVDKATFDRMQTDEERLSDYKYTLAIQFGLSLISLCSGWIIKLFM